jgi:hypothetical protein
MVSALASSVVLVAHPSYCQLVSEHPKARAGITGTWEDKFQHSEGLVEWVLLGGNIFKFHVFGNYIIYHSA